MNPHTLPIERQKAGAFTFIELLVVIAVAATLALLLMPGWHMGREHAINNQCMNDLRQITLGWHMYASDNADILPPNDYPYATEYASETTKIQAEQKNWVVGTMEQPIDSTGGIQTNELVCSNSLLSAYVTNPFVYHCPADNYINPYSHTIQVRSVSMNSAVGTLWWSSSNYTGGSGAPPLGSGIINNWLAGTSWGKNNYLTYSRASSFINPGPAKTWVFIDENPYTINDGSFAASAYAASGHTYLIDFASSNHNNGAGMAFVDGHAVIHQWLDSRTYTPPSSDQPGGGGTSSTYQVPDNLDCFYIASVTSALP